MKNIIPIVLAADNNYAPYMYVTIFSAIKNKSQSSFYDFYLLITDDFSKDVKKKFDDLKARHSNIDIHFIKMGDSFNNCEMNIKHITSPTYYRLKIAEILPQYDKALYLDTDIIVMQDLMEFYNTDLKDNYIAGVQAAGYYFSLNNREYYKSIGLEDLSLYVNAGVILWNIKKIKEENLTAKLCSLAENNYRSQDQDVINVCFQGKIIVLPLKYNFMTRYHQFTINDESELYKCYCDFYGKENFKEAISDPVIIHYANKIKPWNRKWGGIP